jgi:cytochrome c-type biogenesis protein CcmE
VALTDAGTPAGARDDPEAADAQEVALPPRPVAPRRTLLGSRRRQVIAFAVIIAALLVLVFEGLGNATVYFKTADEAVAQRAKLGTRRFRIEGTVQPDVHQARQDVAFTIASNGVTVPVVHRGDPPQLFKAGIPVVLEGHFEGDQFASDQIMVKHTASYVAQHPDRLKTAETSIPAPSTPPAPAASSPAAP